MSASQATIYGAFFAGLFTLIGTLVGVWWSQRLEDRRRRQGDVSIEVRAWTWWGPNVYTHFYEEGKTGCEARRFEIRVFNDRDVNIALWNAQVEFYLNGRWLGSLYAEQDVEDRLQWAPIDLESRKSVYQTLVIVTEAPEVAEQVKSADRVEFVATMMPGGKEVRKSLPLWDDVPERE